MDIWKHEEQRTIKNNELTWTTKIHKEFTYLVKKATFTDELFSGFGIDGYREPHMWHQELWNETNNDRRKILRLSSTAARCKVWSPGGLAVSYLAGQPVKLFQVNDHQNFFLVCPTDVITTPAQIEPPFRQEPTLKRGCTAGSCRNMAMLNTSETKCVRKRCVTVWWMWKSDERTQILASSQSYVASEGRKMGLSGPGFWPS